MNECSLAKRIEGEVVQKISFDEFDDYPIGEIADQDEFEIVRVETPADPNSWFWKIVVEKTPDWLAESVRCFAVLTKNIDEFGIGDAVDLEVVPTFYTVNNIRIKAVSAPLGIPVKILDEVCSTDSGDEHSTTGDENG